MEAAWSPVPGLLHTTSDHRQESCTIRAAKCQVLSVFCSCILGRLSVTGVPGHPGAAVTWKLVNTFPRAPFLSVQEQQAHRVMVLRGGGGGIALPLGRRAAAVPGGGGALLRSSSGAGSSLSLRWAATQLLAWSFCVGREGRRSGRGSLASVHFPLSTGSTGARIPLLKFPRHRFEIRWLKDGTSQPEWGSNKAQI